ncbi:hypothetical protein TSUD_171020 [Trifolium subterraneum]|uniref:TCP domain-containing protein n=1 Tax=Trifolium subterraneum TaxID=3900 RepID=A0A2Z6LSH9_TRISU|nr:hypothetical protein TSUD_171020 [Trifolium subterraneum]
MNSKEAEFPLKQEVNHNSNDQHEKEKASPSSSSLASSSSQWPRLKDPRIVRVSRAFGGKDRHSKVCTIRGLRDRRVRLSVPTAIQLYDLQDRLGLNQPSKVVDWLLNAAKHEIDQLPPLPNFPPIGTNFNFGFPSSNETNTSHLHQQLLNFNRNNIRWEGASSSQNSSWKLNPKEDSREMVSEKPNYWMNRSTQEEENNKQLESNIEGTTPSAIVLQNNNNLLQRPNHPSFLGLLNNMPLGTNYHWGGASSNVVNSSQLGDNIGLITNQTNDGNAITSLPPMLSLSTGNSSQMLLGTTQSYFSSNVNAMEMDHHHHHQREINNHHYHQMLSSSNSQNPLNNSSLNNPSFSLAMMSTPNFLQSSRENSSNKEQDFTPK